LDQSFSAANQVILMILLVGALGFCAHHLYTLWLQLKFPITHPIMSALALYSNDGNALPVMVSINDEMTHNLQGRTGGLESDLHITDSWILHVTSASLEVAFFPDVSRIEPLYDYSNGGMGGGHLSGLQIFCRRGKDFFVPLTTEQFEAIQDNMQARMQATEEIRRTELHSTQLDRLQSLVEVAGTYGRYPVQVAPGSELDDCMVMCGEKVQVKIVKRCTAEMAGGSIHMCEDRRDCFCEPTMCLSCLAKWFGENDSASCPTCRVKFCMHDVVPVEAQATVVH